MTYGPIGFYVTCDDALCVDCYEPEDWHGFEDWTSPLTITSDDEADTPTHCRRCEGLIEHSLTTDGIAYVIEAYEGSVDSSRFPSDGGRRCIVRAWIEAYDDDAGRLEVVASWPTSDRFSPTQEV